jgi:hypothetical protein
MFMAMLLLKLGQPDDALRHLKEAYSQELADADAGDSTETPNLDASS